MKNFLKQQWTDLCERTRCSAEHHAASSPEQKEHFMRECEAFCDSATPGNYSDLLDRTTEARDLAMRWMTAQTSQEATKEVA